MTQHLRAGTHHGARDIAVIESRFAAQLLDRLHRRVRGDVTRVTLEAQLQDLVLLAELARQELRVTVLAVSVEKSESAIEDGVGAFIAAPGELCGKDARLCRTTQMQALHHCTVAGIDERQ